MRHIWSTGFPRRKERAAGVSPAQGNKDNEGLGPPDKQGEDEKTVRIQS